MRKGVIDARFFRVICNGKKKNGASCGRWLGDMQINTPNTARFRCRDCQTLHEFKASSNLVSHKTIPQNTDLDYDPAVTLVEDNG